MVPTLIFLGAGILLLALEIFTPGLGISGLLGAISLLVAVLLQIGNPVGILFMLALVLFLIAVAILLFLRLGMKGKFDRSKIVLTEQIQGDSTGFEKPDFQALIGRRGTADTVLRPAGKAIIGGRSYDVVTGGEFVLKGREVEVIAAAGVHIVVRPAPIEGAPAAEAAPAAELPAEPEA